MFSKIYWNKRNFAGGNFTTLPEVLASKNYFFSTRTFSLAAPSEEIILSMKKSFAPVSPGPMLTVISLQKHAGSVPGLHCITVWSRNDKAVENRY
jgi:hypothetical protein